MKPFAWVPALVVLSILMCGASHAASLPIAVASKKFPESVLLAEMLAQCLEARGVVVERRLNLGNTAVVFESLRRGIVDVYPEYTGTAVEFLGIEAGIPRQRMRRDIEASLAREGLHLGPPLGFENSYALAARAGLAERHALRTITDLSKLLAREPSVRLGFSHEFLARADGWPELAKAYGFTVEPRGVEHGMAYELLAAGQLDVTEVYTTEGLLHAHALRLLSDDRGFFPPYEAAFTYGEEVARSPVFLAALGSLAGRLDRATMQRLNHLVEVDKHRTSDVARSWLAEQGLVATAESHSPTRRREDFWDLMLQTKTWRRVLDHLWLTWCAVLAGVLVGVPLGVLSTRRRGLGALVLGVASGVQTIPSLALLVLVIPVASFLAGLWHGDATVVAALIALFAYALLPIVRNTKEGLAQVDPAVIQAATGMGMTGSQRLFWVLIPLAAPFLIAGVRTSAVIATGSATLAAFIGAGGLGEAIISGLAVQNYAEVLSGAVPAAALALCLEGGLGALQWWTRPRRTSLG